MHLSLPGRQKQVEGGLEFAAVQPGVGRARGGQRVIRRGDGLHLFGRAAQRQAAGGSAGDDELRVAVPTGAALRGEVVEAAGLLCQSGVGAQAVQHQRGDVGQELGAGGGAELVGDHPQAVALRGEFEHGLGEVAPARGVHPGSAQNEMAATAGGDGLFARELAAAVGALRVGGVGLGVAAGRRFGAVEHVVGGVVNQHGVVFRGPGGEHARRCGVDALGQFRVGLGFVDGGVGGGVDDKLRLLALQHGA